MAWSLLHLVPVRTVDQLAVLGQDRVMAEQMMAIDHIDRRIIGLLQQNGRISWRDLAEAVHMASSSVADRVRRLESTGVIRDYRARIDPSALGRDVRAVIDVSLPAGGDPAEVEAPVAGGGEVEVGLLVTRAAGHTVIRVFGGAGGVG